MDLTINDAVFFLLLSYLLSFLRFAKIVEVACLNIISQLMDLATNDTVFFFFFNSKDLVLEMIFLEFE